MATVPARKIEIKYGYIIHSVAALFPELPPDEFQKLKADIEKNGQLAPIILKEGAVRARRIHHRQA